MSATTSGGPLVRVNDLSVHFPVRTGTFRSPTRWVRAVDRVSLDINVGDSVGLVGESGSGKTSLGRALLKLNDYAGGSVTFADNELGSLSRKQIRALRRRMQLVYQDPFSSLDPRMRIQSILEEPLAIHRIVPRRDRAERVRELLRLVSLDPSLANRFPHEFSGGQRQRIGIAQALAVEPEFLVCDEPVSALDVSVQAQIINLLMDLRDRLDLTLLFIGHDLDAVRRLCDRVVVMYLGAIVEEGPTEAIYADPVHPYTRSLLSASPTTDPVFERTRERIVLEGDLPSPEDVPPGCRFHGRCWLYERLGRPETCRTQEPVAVTIGPSHTAACHFPAEAVKPLSAPVGQLGR